MEKSIAIFNEKFYIIDIKNIAFYLLHIPILGIHNWRKEQHEEFKNQGSYKYLLYNCNYVERVVDIFKN